MPKQEKREGEKLEQIEEMVGSDEKADAQINHRIQKANQIYYQIHDILIGKKDIN